MPTRNGHARWEGTLKEGQGTIDFANGAFTAPYSFSSRFEEGAGTNPEELIGAAHAGCFSMAFALMLTQAGFTPDYVDTTAQVSLSPKEGGGFRISKSHLVCEAKVPGIDAATFQDLAGKAKAGCPVSAALSGLEITIDATLA
jgi:osmotically inducible protein OsmC